jgi:hypothetical protein
MKLLLIVSFTVAAATTLAADDNAGFANCDFDVTSLFRAR